MFGEGLNVHRLPRAHARHLFVRSAAAGLGLAVSASLFAVSPAQALDTAPGTAGTPTAAFSGSALFPQIDGVGAITDTVAGTTYTCTNDSSATSLLTCDMLPSLLNSVTGATLTAVPASSSQFAGWTNCPSSQTDPTCTIGPLQTLVLSPIAKFVPISGSGGGTGGGTGTGTGTLETVLTQLPPSTTGPDVLFGLATNPADAAATFTCSLSGPGQTGASGPCTSPVSYSGLAEGLYTFTAAATSGSLTDTTPASWVFTVAADTPLAPETTLSGGPANHGWLLAAGTRFGLSSNQPGVTYSCTLDGQSPQGCSDPVSLTRLAQRTHVFTAAAANALGVADASPATRVFTVPVNNTKLKASTGWAKRKHRGHFLSTFSQTKRKGATLKVRRSAIRSVALVVAKGRGYGTVNVYLGKKLLRKVSLRANRSVGGRVVPIKKFSSKEHGAITVKVVSRGKLVRIEGLGISSR